MATDSINFVPAFRVNVTAAAAGVGAAAVSPYSDKTVAFTIVNTDGQYGIEYKATGDLAWTFLGKGVGARVAGDLSNGLLLRRVNDGSTSVPVDITGEFDTAAYPTPRKGVASMKSVPLGVLGQWSSDNAYLSMSYWPGAGAGRTALARVTGDPALFYQTTPTALGTVPGCTVTTLPGTSVAATNALLDSFGNVIGDGAASINTAFLTKSGDIFFVSTHGASNGNPQNRSALFRARLNAGKTDATVGSDAAASNKKACIDIGRWPQTNVGPWSANIRMLSKASFLEATVAGATHYFYCEYNVAGGARVAGGLNDQCIVYRSIDLGVTWEVFMEFNTGGTNIISHFHGAAQDPYTGMIYFMTGDFNTQNAVISYDGISPKLPANTTLDQIGTKAGFRCINNTELVRFTDLCFTPDKIFTLPDADTEAGDQTSVAYINATLPRSLGNIVSVSVNTARFDKVPPFSAIQHPRLGALFLSFRQSATQQEYDRHPYYDLWSCNVETSEWILVGKIKALRTASEVTNNVAVPAGQNPLAFFVDNQDRVWTSIAADRWDATLNNGIGVVASKSSAMCITMGPRTALPYEFNGYNVVS